MLNTQSSILVKFEKGKIIPVSFEWNNHEYGVKRIPIVFERTNGGRKYLCFGVDTGGALVELRLDREILQFTVCNFQPV